MHRVQAAIAAIGTFEPAIAGQRASDGCIDKLRTLGGPDGRAGFDYSAIPPMQIDEAAESAGW